MSLHWDVTSVKDHATVTTDPHNKGQWHPVTFMLAQVSMLLDLGSITSENISEWAWRLAYLERVGRGGFLNEKRDGEWITRTFTADELHRHIGMRTNVATLKRRQWLTRQNRIIEREVDHAAKKLLDGALAN